MSEIQQNKHRQANINLKAILEAEKPSRYDSELPIAASAAKKIHNEIRELRYKATHDELTGLPNRVGLKASLTDLQVMSRQQSVPIAVVIIDLDRFKKVNDGFGHNTGDKVLVGMAKSFAASLRETDVSAFIARIGGDEFAALLPLIPHTDTDLTPEQRAEAVVGRLEKAATQYVDDAEQTSELKEIGFGASIGVSIYDPTKNGQLSDHFDEADKAMYDRKQQSRS